MSKKTSSLHMAAKAAARSIATSPAGHGQHAASLLLLVSQNALWLVANGYITRSTAGRWERVVSSLLRKAYIDA